MPFISIYHLKYWRLANGSTISFSRWWSGIQLLSHRPILKVYHIQSWIAQTYTLPPYLKSLRSYQGKCKLSHLYTGALVLWSHSNYVIPWSSFLITCSHLFHKEYLLHFPQTVGCQSTSTEIISLTCYALLKLWQYNPIQENYKT